MGFLQKTSQVTLRRFNFGSTNLAAVTSAGRIVDAFPIPKNDPPKCDSCGYLKTLQFIQQTHKSNSKTPLQPN